MNDSRLYRSVHGRVIGGVAGGIADFFGIDPTIVRLLFVLLVVFGGSGILLYIILWIILPEKKNLQSYNSYTPPPAPGTGSANETTSAGGVGETYEGFDQGIPPIYRTDYDPSSPDSYKRKKIEGSLIGGGLLIFVGMLFLIERFIPNINFGDLWPIVLIGLGALLIFSNIPRNNKSDSNDQQNPSNQDNSQTF